MTNKNIRFFKDINRNDTQMVGGKGANLGEMAIAGMPVPNGFCVTTHVYREFIECNDLKAKISSFVEAVTQETVAIVGDEIRKIIINGQLPITLKEEVEVALTSFSDNDFFSIRSSATAEDLEFASFAGQHDTYLNVRGLEEILTHIRKCWASLYTERAILYRIQNGISHDEVLMSVVVQRMVMSEMSGIIFTADPVTGNRNIMSIDAGFGLGEALVSGLVSPDIYKVNKKSMKVVEQVVPCKKIGIIPLPGGGTETKELTKDVGEQQVLDERTILKLVDMAITIEDHYGMPQDIEWCVEDHQIYIVQSRAITSLFPVPSPMPEDDQKHIYISVNHLQSMLNTISPLSLDLMPLIFRGSDVPLTSYKPKIMINAAGRLYVDVTGIMHTRIGKRNIVGALMDAEVLIAKSLESLIEDAVFEGRSRINRKNVIKMLWLLKAVPFKSLGLIFFGNTSLFVSRANENIGNISSQIKKAISGSGAGDKRLKVIYDRMPLLKVFAKSIMSYLLVGILSLKLLEKIATSTFGNSEQVVEMSKGLRGNVTTEMGLVLGDLADTVRSSPELVQQFENDDYQSLFNRIEQLDGHETFKYDFKDFFDKYGCRANGEIDIASVRWEEDPEQIARSVVSMAEGMSKGQHRREYDATVQRAEEACVTFVEAYVKKKGRIKGLIVRRLVKVMRHALPIREHHKYMMMRIYGTIKSTMLEDAKRLVTNGSLESVDDIFWLHYTELYEAYLQQSNLNTLVQKRKESYKHFSQLRPPRVITSEGEIIYGTYDISDYAEDALVGIAVSSGMVEGIAKVIKDPSKESLAKGEILVASFTDPSWTPLFLNAAGLVMEIGGQLTHGTVVAREYGLPAVVGVEDATLRIKTGDKIRIDGNAGVVVILESEG